MTIFACQALISQTAAGEQIHINVGSGGTVWSQQRQLFLE